MSAPLPDLGEQLVRAVRRAKLETFFREAQGRVPLEPVYVEDWELHLQVEKTRRYALNYKLRLDPAARAKVLARCARDPVFWVNNFGWSFDALRADGQPVPFALQDFQDQLFAYVTCTDPGSVGADGKPVKIVVEKGRELGASYVVLFGFGWLWLFRPSVKLGVVSRTGGEVWDRTEGSLFGKLRFILEHLPSWMRPGSWDSMFSSSPKPVLIHPKTGADILGSKTTDDVFRSDRRMRIFGDELASVPRATEVAKSINGATEGAVFVSTPKGRANYYARLVHGEVGLVVDPGTEGPGWRKFRLHHSQDRRKDAAWLAKKKAELSREEFAQEHDIDYEASQPGRYWPDFQPAYHVLHPEEWAEARENLFVMDKGVERPRSGVRLIGAFDFGLFSSCLIGAHDKRTNELFLLCGWLWYDTPVELMVEEIVEAGFSVDGGPGLHVHRWVGDPAGNQRQRARTLDDDARTWIDDFRTAGIDIHTKRVRFLESMNLIRRALSYDNTRLWMAPACALRTDPEWPAVSECFSGYRMHLPRGPRADYRIEGEAKKHGGPESHLGDTGRYLAAWIWDETKVGLVPLDPISQD